MNNDFLSFENEKKHKGIFSLISFSIFSYLLLSFGFVYLTTFILKKLSIDISYDLSMIISTVIQYTIGILPTIFILKKVSYRKTVSQKLKFLDFFKYFSIAIAFIYFGSIISEYLISFLTGFFGSVSEDPIQSVFTKTNYILSFVLSCVLSPIVEEFIFRKMLIDRLDIYGDKIAIFFSSILFSLHHLNVYQFFYAFAFGIILAYIYEKTHNILYTVLIHALSNILLGFVPSLISSDLDLTKLLETVSNSDYSYIQEKLFSVAIYEIYSFLLLALVFGGIISFFKNKRKIYFKKGDVLLPKDSYMSIIFFNVGTVIFIVAALVYSTVVLVI